MQSAPRDVANPKSQVPVWRRLTWSVLSVAYHRILQILAERVRLARQDSTRLPG
ncbi:hypothetical protein ACWGQ5_46195 [Streptomyces sp. NPDC055722]